MAELTVLVPVRHVEAGMLRDSIRSLVEQTLSDLRILLLSTADAENIKGVVDIFQDERIEVVPCDRSDTITEQLNRGIELAASEFIARADADDINEPWRLERQVSLLKEEPSIAVVGSALRIVDTSGREIGTRPYPRSHSAIVKSMHLFNSMAHPSVVFRKEAVVNVGGYRYSGRPAQDYELWSRMIQQGYRFANLAEEGVRYRLHPSSVKSSRQKQTLRSTIDIKRAYWLTTMTLGGRIRFWLEHVLLLMPVELVQRAFVAWQYRSPAVSSAPARTSDA
ncbi:MAG: glycosyltransferase [Planctomycetota bacterium]|jgi:cellulose synthase/poly-beta-1,6-N-acetylglucosamine synthase-like glycosyltransferase